MLSRIKRRSVRRYFADILDMLSLSGNSCTGLEKDIVQRLSSALTHISEKDWQRLVDIVYGEAYGNSRSSTEDKAFVRDIYSKTSEYVYKNVNIFRKMYMKLIKVWL